MKQIHGDIWNESEERALRCITTNCILDRNLHLVMGAGIAKQAKEKYPELPQILGKHVADHGNNVRILSDINIASFPTKYHWKDRSVPELIKRSAHQLWHEVTYKFPYKKVLLPPPGCGLGGLQWRDVKAILDPIFDDRFVIVHYQPKF